MEFIQFMSWKGQKFLKIFEEYHLPISDIYNIFIDDINTSCELEVKRIQDFNLQHNRPINRSVSKVHIIKSDNIQAINRFFHSNKYTKLKNLENYNHVLFIHKAIPTVFNTNDGTLITSDTLLDNIIINIEKVKQLSQYDSQLYLVNDFYDWKIFVDSSL
jgi:hypothetical protein